MVGLGYLLGRYNDSIARGVSADGSVIVGQSCSARYEAFCWDDKNGMRSLRDVLENDYGLDLTDWRLIEATGISDDGFTIVGHGRNPDGNIEGWILRIPEPATILILGMGSLMMRRRKSRISNFEVRFFTLLRSAQNDRHLE